MRKPSPDGGRRRSSHRRASRDPGAVPRRRGTEDHRRESPALPPPAETSYARAAAHADIRAGNSSSSAASWSTGSQVCSPDRWAARYRILDPVPVARSSTRSGPSRGSRPATARVSGTDRAATSAGSRRASQAGKEKSTKRLHGRCSCSAPDVARSLSRLHPPCSRAAVILLKASSQPAAERGHAAHPRQAAGKGAGHRSRRERAGQRRLVAQAGPIHRHRRPRGRRLRPSWC